MVVKGPPTTASVANPPPKTPAKPAAKAPAKPTAAQLNAESAPVTTTPFIEGVLKAIGAPITANTVTAMNNWIAAEGGSNNNPLNLMPNGKLASYGTLEEGIAATAATINQSNMAQIKQSFTANVSPDAIKAATIADPWSASHYAGTSYGGTAAIDAQASADANNPAPIKTPPPHFDPPQAGVDVKNFHGFDLSSFVGTNDLGNAEAAIETYSNPAAKDAQGLTLQQRIAQDYGYTAGWALKHPEVGAVLIWSAQYADPSTAAGRAQELSQLQKTQWYQTTNENQRAFEAAQSTDPAKAHQALVDAQDKVHATAAQIGVNLTPAQMNAIAKTYAALAYVPEGTLGAVSGTSQEQLDEMVVNAATTVQKTGGLPGVDQTATFNPGAVTSGAETGSAGIAPQLFETLKGIAQQYLMYSSSPSSPLTDADLQKYVASYLQNYVGSGSYGSSNLQQGAQQSFTALMQQQSSALYPTLAPVVKMGTTPQTYTKPISNLIENTLGLTTGSVDLTQPKWNFALQNDPTTGAPMTQDQILAKVVQMPEYDTSDTAINNAHTVANGLSSLFGQGA